MYVTACTKYLGICQQNSPADYSMTVGSKKNVHMWTNNKPSESTLQTYCGPHFYLAQFKTLFVPTL